MLNKSAQPFNRWLGHLEREMRLAESCPDVPHHHGSAPAHLLRQRCWQLARHSGAIGKTHNFQEAFALAFCAWWCLFDYSPFYSYGFNVVLFLFPPCQCSLLSLLFSRDMWTDFMVHTEEKTFSAVQRVRVKTTEGTIVQPTGPWLDSDIARVVNSRFQGDLHGFQYHLHCWWLCDHKSH